MVSAYLEKLQEEYLEKKIQIEKTLLGLEMQLKENIEFIKYLEENTDVSFESFSPRDVNAKSKTKIKELKEKQVTLKELIEAEKIKKEEIIQRLDELTNVIKVAHSTISTSEDKKNDSEIDHHQYRLKLLETQENERQRISRELHDSTVQNLTSMIHKLELCSKLIDMDPIRCKLELTMMSRTLKDIINDTRQMIYNLRPMSFDDIGLEVTIERALEKLKNEKACNINFVVQGEPYHIKPVIGITLLRIIQEGCSNAMKYANASLISIKLIYNENDVSILIEDDGIGFDVENLNVFERKDNSGFGLSMMKERVYLLSGEISMQSKINEGTKIIVKVPINQKEDK